MKNKAEFSKKAPIMERSSANLILLLEERTEDQRNSMICLLMMGLGLEPIPPGISTGILNS